MKSASEHALEHAVQQSWRRFRVASIVHRTVRAGVLSLGLSAAVLLPLVGSNAPPSINVSRTYDFGDQTRVIHEAGEPAQAVPDLVVNPATVQVYTQSAPTPRGVVIPVEYRQISAPPIATGWHRVPFENVRDRFVALPGNRFTLTLDGTPGNCTGPALEIEGGPAPVCATLKFSETPYTQFANQSIVISGIDIVLNTNQPEDQQLCQRLRPNRQPFLLCKMDLAGAAVDGGPPDICLKIRRSRVVERPAEMLAVDIMWSKLDLAESSCMEWED